MSIDFHFNWDQVASQLEQRMLRLTDAVEQDVEQALHKSALLVEADAVMRAPVNDGQLRNSIRVRQVGTGTKARFEVFVGAAHGQFVEFGTRPHAAPFNAIKDWADRNGIDNWFGVWKSIKEHGTKPHPFLRPAFYINEQTIKAEIKNAFIQAMRRR
jgi:HK97 gp10 family phage protein